MTLLNPTSQQHLQIRSLRLSSAETRKLNFRGSKVNTLDRWKDAKKKKWAKEQETAV